MFGEKDDNKQERMKLGLRNGRMYHTSAEGSDDGIGRAGMPRLS